MYFEEKFFQGEERDGFYVEGEMKRAWAAEMEVFMEIDRICRKHNIPYFADSGTLLGAVRHNGFVPWDDDMDVAMLRKNYMKFISVAQSELRDSMHCSDMYHDETWSQPFARVINGTAGIKLTPEHLEKYHGCPYSVGVDVFVLDDMPSTEAEFDTTVDLFEWTFTIGGLFKERDKHIEQVEDEEKKIEIANEWNEKIEEQLVKLEEYCNIKIDRAKHIYNQLLRIIDGLFAMYHDEGSDEVVNYSYAKHGTFYGAGKKKEWYRDSIMLPFENILVPVPIDYKKVLEKSYGPNYLEPIKKWKYHDYPFYKENKRKLQRAKKDVRNIKGKMDRLEQVLKGEG